MMGIDRYLNEVISESVSFDENEEQGTKDGAILVTVLVLILATIGFERVKELLEERAQKTFEPVVEKLFGELAVLGFLSLCTFCFAQTHFFEFLASGGLDEEEIEHIVEFTHYILFFIVINSVINVCVLIMQAEGIMKRWEKFDKLINIHGRDAFLRRSSPRKARKSLARSVLPELAEDSLFLKFCALQEEFHLDRELSPPFQPNAGFQLDENFNFAAYLGKCLEKTLEEIVEIQEPTYWIFALFVVIFYAYSSLLEHNMRALSWIWVVLNYSTIGMNAWLVNHLSIVADALGANSDGLMAGLASTRPVAAGSRIDPLLPLWCSVELNDDDKRNRRNRQEKLFIFQEHGPRAYMIILQTNLVFSSIYWAMLFISYFPYMYKEHPFSHFCGYVIVALIPPRFINKQWVSMLALLTEVLSVGHLRRPRVIATVIRDQKIESMIRSFLLVKRVDEFVKSMEGNSEHPARQDIADISSRSVTSMASRTSSSTIVIRRRVQAAFNSMDENGDGHLDEAEFESLLQKLGIPVTQEMGHNIVSALDIDGDGVIDVEELEVFYKAIMMDSSCPHDMAKDLFSIFDLNGNGVISPIEFARVMETMNLGFTVEDVGQILQEIDEDGDGEITFHEFERMIEEYMPAEFFGENEEEIGEELEVHPLVSTLEGIGHACQEFFSFGTRQQRRRSSQYSYSNARRGSMIKQPSVIFRDPLAEQAIGTSVSYGSLLDDTYIDSESSE